MLQIRDARLDDLPAIEEMVDAAKDRGLKYIAITDHSKRVTMANGLDADRLRAHWKAIDKVRKKTTGIEVLCGIECDILENAELDLPDDVLAEADWVIAVLHYGLKQPREQITRRMLDAIENPYVSAIAHPTGRILNRRKSYDVDLDTIFKAAKQHGKFMELNANPARLDLDDLNCAAAKSHGIPIVISTDAHSAAALHNLRWGVQMARRSAGKAKPKSVASGGQRSRGNAPAAESGLLERLAVIERERDALLAALSLERERRRKLEEVHAAVRDRVAWALDSLQAIIEARN